MPLLGLLALLVRLKLGAPVLFRHQRPGLHGRPFTMLKFRTMTDTRDAQGNLLHDKERLTRFGLILRSASLDELPELFNVLKGDMSLVGPRPERPAFVHEFKHKIPDYMLRHRVRAGITGWAQVHGWRGNTSIKKRIQYDIYYIQNWSLLLDLKILWMTFRSGAWHNAY